MGRIFNFSAGPAILPEPVLAQASDAVCEFAGSGMSLLEMSHRDKRYDTIHEQVRAGVASRARARSATSRISSSVRSITSW